MKDVWEQEAADTRREESHAIWEAVDRFCLEVLGYKCGGISAYYSDVSQAPSSDSIYRKTVIFICPFDTEKIALGVKFGLAEEKSALS